jgi:FAD/FMN-containing dehydrogenase
MKDEGLSWGRFPRVSQRILSFPDRRADLPSADVKMLPRGNGRSYGDSCLNAGGILLDTRGMDRFIKFDATTGVVECEAGVLFADILALAVPQGWFLPVTPGTRYVTVGGAIANDVHGKNHHRAGTIGHHVLGLELLRTGAQRIYCSATENPDWFVATIGGLGLTGMITRATIQLRRIASPWMITETHRFENLQGFFDLSARSDRDYEYTVAWVDCAARGRSLGRGLFSRGNHAPASPDTQPRPPSTRLGVPFTPPASAVNRLSLNMFNKLYYHRQLTAVSHATMHFAPFFYPLDAIAHWNRLYGPAGFLQYQCVVPPADAEAAVAELMRLISESGQGSFLAVLKQFGDTPSLGMLSFARPGTTLALDFSNRGAATFELLDKLDEVVSAAGGAVYPAKDARMSKDNFQEYFPHWKDFTSFIDPSISSSFWRRVTE